MFLGIWGPASAFNLERELYHLAKGIRNLMYGPNHISDYWKEFRSIQYLCRSLGVNRGSWGGPKGSSKNSVSRWFLLCLKIGHALRSPCSPGTYLLMSFHIYPSTSDDRSTEEMRPEMLFIIHNGHSTEINGIAKLVEMARPWGWVQTQLQDQELGLGVCAYNPSTRKLRQKDGHFETKLW